MEIKWYAPMKLLGLVKDVSGEYNDGTTYVVSAKCDKVFLWIIAGFMVMCFACGIWMMLLGKNGRKAVRNVALVLLGYAVLLAVGIGPYVKLYPQGGGFVDMSVIENIVDGAYMALCALSVCLGGVCVNIVKKIKKGRCRTNGL